MINKPIILGAILLVLSILSSCDLFNQEPIEEEKIEIIPDKIYVDIPNSICSSELEERFKTMTGDSIYNYMRYFVYLSQNANRIVQKTYNRLLSIDNQGVLEFSFTGVDGITKNVIIRENYPIDGDSSYYYMEIYNKNYSDLALKSVWKFNPLQQIIIFHPSKLDQNEMTDHPNALVRIEYQVQAEGTDYDTLSSTFIYGLTDTIAHIYTPDNILLSIGKKGNMIELIGSTNNPNAYFFDTNYSGGRNWTFFAKADNVKNIACAQIALPPSWVESIENIFADYSIKKVFADELRISNPEFAYLTDLELFNMVGINPEELESPGYFDSEGFISAGPNIPAGFENLDNFELFGPYIPKTVRDSTIILQY